MTRPCLACEGTGRVRDLAAEKRHAEKWGHPAIPAFMVPPRRAWTLSCPVCLGSGQVEAKPPARDALADAETLRESPWAVYVGQGSIAVHIGRAEDNAAQAIENRLPSDAAVHATWAARAAFRAVPGLRG